MILQTNINDKLYKELLQKHSEEELEAAINTALENYLENLGDTLDAKIALERKNNPSKLCSMEEVFGE